MQVDPANSNRRVGLWMGKASSSTADNNNRTSGRTSSNSSASGSHPRSPFRNHHSRIPFEDQYDHDEDYWDQEEEEEDDGPSLFVHPRHLLEKKQHPSNNNNNNTARAAASKQRKAMKKAALRMRPQKAASSSSSTKLSPKKKNYINDLLEMPRWEHPMPYNSSNSSNNNTSNRKQSTRSSSSSSASASASKGRLGQLLDGGHDTDDEEETEGRATTGGAYISQSKKMGSNASQSVKSTTATRSKKSSAVSLGQRPMALNLEDLESDDDGSMMGVELFKSAKKSKHLGSDDDDDSSDSESIECFKPKPSKQEMAQDVLRTFDQELRMEAEKSKASQRQHKKNILPQEEEDEDEDDDEEEPEKSSSSALKTTTSPPAAPPPPRAPLDPPAPHLSDTYAHPAGFRKSSSGPTRSSRSTSYHPNIRNIEGDGSDEDFPIETFIPSTATTCAPVTSTTQRHTTTTLPQSPGLAHGGETVSSGSSRSSTKKNSSTSAMLNSLPVASEKSHPRPDPSPSPVFHDSLKFVDLELNGSIDFGDIEPFTAPTNMDDDDDDNNSIGMQSCGSAASVDMLTQKEKDDLEEKMIRIAMEHSLNSSSSLLDDISPATGPGAVVFHGSGSFSAIDIGDIDDDASDEMEAMAEDILEKEMLELALQRSLGDSKKSDYTATTNPISSDYADSSGASGSTVNSQRRRHRQAPPTGLSNASPVTRQRRAQATPYGASSNSPNQENSGSSSRGGSTRSSSSHASRSGGSQHGVRCQAENLLKHGKTERQRDNTRGQERHGRPQRHSSRRSSSKDKDDKASSSASRSGRRTARNSRPVQDI